MPYPPWTLALVALVLATSSCGARETTRPTGAPITTSAPEAGRSETLPPFLRGLRADPAGGVMLLLGLDSVPAPVALEQNPTFLLLRTEATTRGGVVRIRDHAVALDLTQRSPDDAARLILAHPFAAASLRASLATLCAPEVRAALARAGRRELAIAIDAYGFDNARLSCLEGIAPAGLYLLLPPATDDSGLDALAVVTPIRHLGLERSLVSDAGVGRLAARADLVGIGLSGTRVTPAGVAALAKMRQLGSLDLSHVATDEMLGLIAALPKRHGETGPDPIGPRRGCRCPASPDRRSPRRTSRAGARPFAPGRLSSLSGRPTAAPARERGAGQRRPLAGWAGRCPGETNRR